MPRDSFVFFEEFSEDEMRVDAVIRNLEKLKFEVEKSLNK